MKIACIISTLSKGGGTLQLLQLARHLSKNHEVTIFTYTDTTNSYYKSIIGSIPLVVVKKEKKVNENRIYQLLLPYIRSIHIASEISKHKKFDVLNPHEYNASWAAIFVKLIKQTPIVWMCNDVWHIPGFEEKKEKRRLFSLFNKTIQWWTDYFLIQWVNTTVVLDHRIKRIIKKKYNRNAVVVRSGIDLSNFSNRPSQTEARQKLKLTEKEIFLCMSIFFQHRRFEDVLIAFSYYIKDNSDSRLVIIGDSSHDRGYFQFIKKEIERLNLEEKVTVIPNFITEKEKILYLSACNTYIYPNEKQTWGLSVIEAMACEKYCIVSSGAGVHEIITEKIGTIYPVGDIIALYNAMSVQKKHNEIGKNARKFVIDNFSWDNYGETMEKEIKKVY